MPQHRLTDAEARQLAAEYASTHMQLSTCQYTNVNTWLAEYMESYNIAMDAILRYNDSVTN